MGGPHADWITDAEARVADLSERQREVFLALGDGLSTREIAARLGISEHTVKLHTTHVLQTLGLNSRLQVGLVAFAHLSGHSSGCDACLLNRAAGSQRSSCDHP